MFQDPNQSRRLTWKALLAFAVTLSILFIWTVSTSPRRAAPVVEQIATQVAPRILSAADATSLLLANYYPSKTGAGGAVLGNESLLKIVSNPAGAGFVPQPQALAQIEREALERLAKPGWHPIHPEKYIRPIFPEHYAESIEVASQACKVRSKPLGANASSTVALSGDGSLIYADAFPGCDIVYRSSALKTEEFIVLRDNHAQAEWSWELDCGAALTPRLTPAHTIEFVDKKGVPRQRINAPEGKDAAGVRLRVGEQLKWRLDGARITVAADVKGLKFPVVIDPTWSSTGNMASPREEYTVTLLNSGKVLIAGGDDGSVDLAKCELYDSASGNWTATGSMGLARSRHTSTLLNNGTVLVTGGSGSKFCEIYDATNGTWSNTVSMATGRVAHTASLLPSGQVLVAGGYDGSALASCEVFDPTIPSWTSTGMLANARWVHTTTLLNNGNILVAGGLSSSNNSLSSCEIFDQSSGTWTSTGGLVSTRDTHVSVLLSNGNVLATGGRRTAIGPVTSCEIFDVPSGTWSSTGAMATERAVHSAVPLGNGHVLVAGGQSLSGTLALCEVYDSITGNWTSIAGMSVPREQYNCVVLSNGNILAAGGYYIPNHITSLCEVFDPKPTASPQTLSTHFGTSLNITLSGLTLVTPLNYTVIQQTLNGVLSGVAPNLTYTPSAGYIGSDTFTFKVNDGTFDSNIATVSINVTDTVPIASSQTVSTHFGTELQILLSAIDADGDPLTYTVSLPSHGMLAGTAPNVAYTPSAGYVGPDTFTFKVNDGALDSAVATVSINVTDTVPTASSQSVSTHFGKALQIVLSAIDADGDPLTFTVSTPSHGMLSGTAKNVTYTPSAGYVGSDTFTFKVNDGALDSNTSSVTINVIDLAKKYVRTLWPRPISRGSRAVLSKFEIG